MYYNSQRVVKEDKDMTGNKRIDWKLKVMNTKNPIPKKNRLSPTSEDHPSQKGSPCAGKCKHQWCAGYHAGYSDGEVDAESDNRRFGKFKGR